MGRPARTADARQGRRRDQGRHGKTKYSPVIEFTDRETRDRFSNAVLAALIEFAPAAFEPEPV